MIDGLLVSVLPADEDRSQFEHFTGCTGSSSPDPDPDPDPVPVCHMVDAVQVDPV